MKGKTLSAKLLALCGMFLIFNCSAPIPGSPELQALPASPCGGDNPLSCSVSSIGITDEIPCVDDNDYYSQLEQPTHTQTPHFELDPFYSEDPLGRTQPGESPIRRSSELEAREEDENFDPLNRTISGRVPRSTREFSTQTEATLSEPPQSPEETIISAQTQQLTPQTNTQPTPEHHAWTKLLELPKIRSLMHLLGVWPVAKEVALAAQEAINFANYCSRHCSCVFDAIDTAKVARRQETKAVLATFAQEAFGDGQLAMFNANKSLKHCDELTASILYSDPNKTDVNQAWHEAQKTVDRCTRVLEHAQKECEALQV